MIREKIEVLEGEENEARSKSHFHEIEQKWEVLLSSSNLHWDDLREVLKEYNRFRLRNLLVLRRKRPAVLLGYVNDHHFPNFHTLELLKIADVVSLTTSVEKENSSIDRIYYLPSTDDFSTIRKRFPKGFRPNLFLDMQAAHGHMQPNGLSQMPFPTVAGICHHQHGPAAKTICEMFDLVLPVGKVFSPACSYQKAKVFNLPFGLNWASFHQSLGEPSDWKSRQIDVSVTFSKNNNPAYHGLRDQVIQCVENFKSKWSEQYVVKIESNLSKAEYVNLLKNSKISINVVAINGPYNYRTCEIINSGALLFQANVVEQGLKFSLDGVLDEEKDFISFDSKNLEEKLIHFLSNPEKGNLVALNGQERMKSEYSYDGMLKELLNFLKIEDQLAKKRQINLPKDQFLLGKLLWQQHQKQDIQLLGAAFLGNILNDEEDNLRFFSNTLAILPELLNSLGFETIKQLVAKRSNDLAESLDPKNLKQIAVKLLSVKMDHVAMWYNFIALSIDFQWSTKEVLQEITDQALKNNLWEGYSQHWLLRPPLRLPHENQEGFLSLRYENFFLPLMKTKNYPEEWIAYRNFQIALVNI
jgi:hypothetical protein